MKILYLKTNDPDLKHVNDYLHDTLLIGLRKMFGEDIIDYPGAWYMYQTECKKRQIDQKNFWGRGFTLYDILDNYDKIDRDDIKSKITNNYFDFIIYGSIRGENLFYDEVIKSKSKIVFIDTSDDPSIDKEKLNKGFYFKRELYDKSSNIFPISFAIPSEKICDEINLNIKNILSPLIPGKISTYNYYEEQKYFKMYNDSLFSLTYRKTGWDCLRHYEILASGSIPLFLDIKNCPQSTCNSLPKKKLVSALEDFSWIINHYNPFKTLKKRYSKFNSFTKYIFNFFSVLPEPKELCEKHPSIQEYRIDLLEFTKKKLTSEKLAEYLISTLRKY